MDIIERIFQQKINSTTKKCQMPNRDEFLASYIQSQRFSIPNSIIYYIARNPFSPQSYQKWIKICKYFFIKNPILVIYSLCFTSAELSRIFYSLNSKNTKLWITGGFVIPSPPPPSSSTSTSSNESSFQGLFCSIISKLYYKCEIARLYLYDISLTLNEFIFLSSSAENVILNNVSIKYCNGEEVELEKLVQFCSKAVKFEYAFLSNATNFSSKTIKNLIKIPHFFMLKKFRLINIPDIFDIKPLLSFLKKTNLYVCLDFCENLSEDYRNQLNDIIVEILDETDNAYLFGPPSLKIPGINFETQLALFRKARYSEI